MTGYEDVFFNVYKGNRLVNPVLRLRISLAIAARTERGQMPRGFTLALDVERSHGKSYETRQRSYGAEESADSPVTG